MAGYLLPVVFLIVVFVAFALVNRNRRGPCAGCSGVCDKTDCEKSV
jgi:hypothetical protein